MEDKKVKETMPQASVEDETIKPLEQPWKKSDEINNIDTLKKYIDNQCMADGLSTSQKSATKTHEGMKKRMSLSKIQKKDANYRKKCITLCKPLCEVPEQRQELEKNEKFSTTNDISYSSNLGYVTATAENIMFKDYQSYAQRLEFNETESSIANDITKKFSKTPGISYPLSLQLPGEVIQVIKAGTRGMHPMINEEEPLPPPPNIQQLELNGIELQNEEELH